MRLYTLPRPLALWSLRTGDQVATLSKGGKVIIDEAAYIDADLRGAVVWETVIKVDKHASLRPPLVEVFHTGGQFEDRPGGPVVVRESIELDPWSYVTSGGHDRPSVPAQR